ncbi:MAG: AAA family ATPase [Candidatus Methanomethylicaceae archaeon]
MVDERIKEDLLNLHQTMLSRGELLTKTQLDDYCATFRHRFGPEVLANLDGEALLTIIHDYGNRDSLVYWLEFKNDNEFPTFRFGSIAGGSKHKFGIFKRKETGTWMAGPPQRERDLSLSEAISIARRHRDQLIAGAQRLARLPEKADDDTYAQLQADLAQIAPNIYDTAWGHKYLTLLYLDRLDDYHNPDFQRFYLIKMLIEPPPGEGRYICAPRFVSAAQVLGIPLNHLSKLLDVRHGKPHRYWRVLVNYPEQGGHLWDLMREEKCVALPWAKIGDLSALKHDLPPREQIQALMKVHYNASGKLASEVFRFTTLMAERDIVLAFDGRQILGIGRVRSGYQYVVDSHAPHRHEVEWLDETIWELPQNETVTATVQEIKIPRSLIEIERHLLQTVSPSPATKPQPPLTSIALPLQPRTAPVLPGIPGRIQAILDRKRQVILYGPPGTGKTYWARLTAQDLAAYAAFGTPFDRLSPDQQKLVLGDGREQAGLVRLCTFHPAYGYEDFLEGYRPLQVNGQLTFERRDGIFKRLCDDARKDPERHYFLIVDEINRGDIPRIFGELLTVLERDKRGQPILLPLSGELFSVPDNVYLIGTMNTADRSIALLDTALRRRFGFVELMPDSHVLGKTIVSGIPLGPWLDALNRRICEYIGRDARNLQVGHAYLLEDGKPVADFAHFARIIQDDIIPLLEEYCYEDYDALERILGSDLVDCVNQRIRHELFDPNRWEELVKALLAPAPDIVTSVSAALAQEGAPSEEIKTSNGDEISMHVS